MRFLRWLIPALVLVAMACAPPAGAIVAGAPVQITDHPYQARAVMSASDGRYSCGAVVYDSTHVITAAHCVYINGTLLAPSQVAVGYGSADRRDLTGASVAEVTIPSAYLNDGSYDVALLTLAAPLTFSNSVAPIPLASAQTLTAGINAPEANAFATGWGDTTFEGASPNFLRGVDLPLRDDAICAADVHYVGGYAGARSVCAGGKAPGPDAPDTCQGDSGGPLALDSGGGYELVALTSTGFECGRSFTPAIYTETSNAEIKAVIDGSAPASSTLRGSQIAPPSSGGGAPPVTIPPSQAPAPPPPGATTATRDTTRPTARLSKLSCTRKRKRKCSFKIAAADRGGTIKKFSATVSRRVRTCKRRGDFRVCRITTRKKTLRPKRVSGGFTFSAKLVKAKYKLSAVATDAAGNRSKTLTKTFRVR